MRISRRQFVGCSAACASGVGMLGLAGSSLANAPPEADCALLDLGASCALPESFQGYRTVLSAATIFPVADLHRWRPRCRLVIVPGAGIIDTAIASRIVELLEVGTIVVLESGAGFLPAQEFASQRQTLRTFFDVEVGDPVDVWSENRSAPYIEYDWPRRLMVRDFSRLVPVFAPDAEIFGRVDELPIALKKPSANGLLIFLGSPLGPALRAGDLEARAWLQSLTSTI